jgi:hypothetical protein
MDDHFLAPVLVRGLHKHRRLAERAYDRGVPIEESGLARRRGRYQQAAHPDFGGALDPLPGYRSVAAKTVSAPALIASSAPNPPMM